MISLGLWEGFQAAVDYAPDALATMYTNLVGSGGSPEKLAASKDKGKQVLMMETARQGIYLDESAGLTRKEAEGFRRALQKFGYDLSRSADAAQVARPQSTDPAAEKAAFLLSMNRVCGRLGLSGANRFRDLYEVATVINSIKETDVQDAETHERYYGPIRR